MRMIQGMKNLDYSARLDVLRLWSLEERRNRSDLIKLFKMLRLEQRLESNNYLNAH